MPATWIQYGVDALDAGYADPYNPVDAVFAAARYLRAAGAATDLHGAILAYNHSEEYVDSVLLRAKLISSYPKSVDRDAHRPDRRPRLPVSGKQVAWGALSTAPAPSKVASGSNATAGAAAVASKPAAKLSAPTHGAAAPSPAAAPAPSAAAPGSAKAAKHANLLQLVDLMSAPNAEIVAAQDGRIVKLGDSQKLGKYLIMRDVYGDVFTYAGLGSIASHYPKPKAPKVKNGAAAATSPAACRERERNEADAAGDGRTSRARHAERQDAARTRIGAGAGSTSEPAPALSGKVRLFAHPGNPDALASAAVKRKSRSSRAGRLLPLRAGSIVSKGTVLGRVSTPSGAHDGHLRFAIRPGGDQSTVDPRPFLENWAAARRRAAPARRQQRRSRSARRDRQRRLSDVAGRTAAHGALGPRHRHLPVRPRRHRHGQDRQARPGRARVPLAQST